MTSREAIQSSRLEGTYASPRELLLFELDPHPGEPHQKDSNDRLEVYNYAQALEHASASELPLSLRLIREMHGILLRNVRGRDRSPGSFRNVQVAIGTNRRFVPPPSIELPALLDDFERSLHGSPRFDPLIDCFIAHYQFETIHPFIDGNGRVGRLLLAAMVKDRCQLTKPWLYLSEYFERHKDEYCDNLFNVSALGDWDTWIEFCLRGTIEQAQATVKRCDRLSMLRDEFFQTLGKTKGSARLTRLVERLFHSPFLRIPEAARMLGVTYPTAASDLKRLADVGVLQKLSESPNKTYYSSKIYQAAYGDIEEL
jgi:Fic family protein